MATKKTRPGTSEPRALGAIGGADEAASAEGVEAETASAAVSTEADATAVPVSEAKEDEAGETNHHPVPGGGVSGMRNLSQRSARKGGDKLELSRSGKASRKSTRKSKGRVKRTTNLQLRAERKSCSPSARAGRAHG
jgi:hypothetical protein